MNFTKPTKAAFGMSLLLAVIVSTSGILVACVAGDVPPKDTMSGMSSVSSGEPKDTTSGTSSIASSEPTSSASTPSEPTSSQSQDAASEPPASDTAGESQNLFATVMPVEYERITALFGERTIGANKSFHRGVDLKAENGTDIKAAAAGKVIMAEYDGSYGNIVKIEHEDKTQTWYAHCDTLLVEVGDTVSAGKVIATVGSTGASTGNHLHIEYLVDGVACDPVAILGELKSEGDVTLKSD